MHDFAMKHAMKKRMAKGGMECPGEDCPGCGAAMCMAEGGEAYSSENAMNSNFDKEKHHTEAARKLLDPKSRPSSHDGKPVYGPRHPASPGYKAQPGKEKEFKEHLEAGERAGGHAHRMKMAKMEGYAEGGEVEDGDMIDRIMRKHFSKGGMVANDDEPIADGEPAQYDELAKDDHLEFHDTGANSGDEIGDAQEDDDRKDIVSRIMRSRSKKDRMPRPA